MCYNLIIKDRFKSLKPKGIDTMATTKNAMTNKSALEIALALVQESAHPEKALVAEKLQKQIASIEKKKSAPSKAQTAKQTANLGMGESLVEFLRENRNQMFTIAELMKQVPNLPEDVSNQKMTSLFRLDSVRPYYRRDVVKGKAYFQYAEIVETEEEG
jgi:hypothetical protein